MEDTRKIEQTSLNEGNNKLEINPVDGKLNEVLAKDIDFVEEFEKLADKVEKENGHIVFVFDDPVNFVIAFRKIKQEKLYEAIPDGYALLKWNVGDEVRAEIIPKDKAEMFVETATYDMAAEMYTKYDFENEENGEYEDYVVGEE